MPASQGCTTACELKNVNTAFLAGLDIMDKIKVSIQILPGNEDIPLPRYMTDQAAGMDIHAAVAQTEVIMPGQIKKIATGIAIALPGGYEAQIRPRSGLALKRGVTLANSPGTIDADYRGEIGLILINHGEEPFVVNRGMRLAQMVVQKVCRVDWMEADELEETDRGDGGFGHT